MDSIIYALGDIHGCSDLLRERLHAIHAHAAGHGIFRPRLVLLGDYGDRGPDTKGVLDILTGPESSCFDLVPLLGNHDAALIAILRGGDPSADWLHEEGGHATMDSYGPCLRSRNLRIAARKLREAVPAAHRVFLSDLHLSWRCGRWFFCHAGIDPALPLDEQSHSALVYGHPGWIACMRSAAGEECRPAADASIVHGHWTERNRRPAIHEHRVGLDTGAGFAYGRLTAAAFHEDRVEILP
ncbi:putative pphB serine/threonine protein phosphatase or Metallo-dependent phosphatases (plasmid) [Magnetospirillum sp. XM-1]|uniref:metallophosphoesterase n=1 Tax=Magnetospirillum sp. XM-1 TaxID=1663591 RepID=UPI00073DCCD5|nr:metallophosphoesterase [Magnetospirillum sp. XM-1]CUW41863.1 putative pphB serine/threonine protein phosphatase or Metallo-dependent phosphatases [Magnetospirillum sp. XM-1]